MNNTQRCIISLLDYLNMDYTYIEDDKENMVLAGDNEEISLEMSYFHIGLAAMIVMYINDERFVGYDDGSISILMDEITKI